MNGIELFENEELGCSLRAVEVNNGPWFIAKDVCGALEEAGFYKLVMRSRKPEAKAFQRWVTHEVLPAIRRDGAE